MASGSQPHPSLPVPPVAAGPNEYEVSESDWRRDFPTLSEKIKFIFINQEKFIDVQFKVGHGTEQEVIGSVKFVLQMGSSVLDRLITHTKKGDIINLPNLNVKAFKSVIEFLFCDTLNFATLNPYEIFEIMDMSKKLKVFHLHKLCFNALKTSLSLETTVLYVLLSSQYNENEMHNEACLYIRRNAEEVFKHSSFPNLTIEDLFIILKEDDLQAEEFSVFQALLRWAEEKCMAAGLRVSPMNQQVVLNDAHLLVRFPLMTPKCFIHKVIPTQILTREESQEMVKYLTSNEQERPNGPTRFCTNPRTYQKPPENQ